MSEKGEAPLIGPGHDYLPAEADERGADSTVDEAPGLPSRPFETRRRGRPAREGPASFFLVGPREGRSRQLCFEGTCGAGVTACGAAYWTGAAYWYCTGAAQTTGTFRLTFL
jgi:hypothetical protein